MNIIINVTGGTHKTTRFKMVINEESVGELQIDRANFTKFCDLLYEGKYAVTGNSHKPETL